MSGGNKKFMIICGKCGAENEDDKLFCTTCGNSLKKEHFGEFLKYVIIIVFILAVAMFLIVILPMLRNRDYIEYQKLENVFSKIWLHCF